MRFHAVGCTAARERLAPVARGVRVVGGPGNAGRGGLWSEGRAVHSAANAAGAGSSARRDAASSHTGAASGRAGDATSRHDHTAAGCARRRPGRRAGAAGWTRRPRHTAASAAASARRDCAGAATDRLGDETDAGSASGSEGGLLGRG